MLTSRTLARISPAPGAGLSSPERRWEYLVPVENRESSAWRPLRRMRASIHINATVTSDVTRTGWSSLFQDIGSASAAKYARIVIVRWSGMGYVTLGTI